MIVGIPILISLGFVFLAYTVIRVDEKLCERRINRTKAKYLPPEQPNMTVAHLIDRQWDETLRAIHELPERTP